ncbi:hypothetical protein [Paraburkholderia saeva]|uniref:Uncharacterized protein n=1 Tax=Paraburkholderia saeva TaxID=2777537 RepID=A0A9N8S0P4_9BURK|nr:hypothetical protein [Paraburkholderia saeva]CAG4919234.1 hypothetical protein LMG31841_04857 [Paraburkholderia saeva]
MTETLNSELRAAESTTAVGLAMRAQQELAAAMVALQHAGALFAAIEEAAGPDANFSQAFLLAQIGVETTGYQMERAESGSDFFRRETGHGR